MPKNILAGNLFRLSCHKLLVPVLVTAFSVTFTPVVNGKVVPGKIEKKNPSNSQDITNPAVVSAFSKKHVPFSFIENKGQVTDQNRNARTDIQFQVNATHGLNIFIGNGALHYQFSKTDQQPRHPRITEMTEVDNIPVTYTMYRLDVELVGANKNAHVITDSRLAYYEKHITPTTGENGTDVNAWSKITYQDVYPNIDWMCM